MRVLVIHQNFPGQFRQIVAHWATQPDVDMLAIGRDTAPGMPGVRCLRYRPHRAVRNNQHHYLRQMEDAVLHGQSVARLLLKLKSRGYRPDVILAHPGWGETLYAKDVFPNTRLVHFCEWFYGTEDADWDFDPEFPATFDDKARVRTWNALHTLNLENCDAGITPTHWQHSRHPAAYRNKIAVIHEGIDTDFLAPVWATAPYDHAKENPPAPAPVWVPMSIVRDDHPASEPVIALAHTGKPRTSGPFVGPDSSGQSEVKTRRLILPNGTTLKTGDPVITYVARNLEPYRGFHSFMRALERVQKENKHCHAVIVGGDEVSYGKRPTNAPNWREKLLAEVSLDPKRTHFLGKVPYDTYRKVLQISSAHVYLTYPFVLSWSMLEAMASGCLVIGSNTAPVREVIRHQENGLLVDFFDSARIAETLVKSLDSPDHALPMRRQAARDIANKYSRQAGLSAYQGLLNAQKNACHEWPPKMAQPGALRA